MDPEGQPFTVFFRIAGTNELPFFVKQAFPNGTLSGFATDGDVGTYDFECVGVDDALSETVIAF